MALIGMERLCRLFFLKGVMMKRFSAIIAATLFFFVGGWVHAADLGIRSSVPTQLPAAKRPIKITKPEILKVTYPSMTHHLSYENKKIVVTVRFSADVDKATVVPGSTVRLDFPKAANAPGQITWTNSREFKWKHNAEKSLDVCRYDPDCEFKLTLTDEIKSEGGARLDGDNNNQEGGTFTNWFIDLG
jgi:hypothetical protein